jgi:ABC-type multidrug transport system ATPase subunit
VAEGTVKATDEDGRVEGQVALLVDRAGRDFGTRRVLDEISFTLAPGERLAVKGPNGSGKTTLIRCLAGSMFLTRGTIDILGAPAGSFQARRSVGASLSPERSFYPRLSVRQNLLFFSRLRHRDGAEAKRAVERIEEELELTAVSRARTDTCSSGTLQRVAVARGLLGDPPVLLLDEPTRSLDERSINLVWEAIDRRRHSTLVVATHTQYDADRCDRHLQLGGSGAP